MLTPVNPVCPNARGVSRLPALRAALAGRGVAEAALNAVWGGNVLRVLAEADQRRTAA